MPTNTTPPTRRRTKPIPGAQGKTSNAPVLDEAAPQIMDKIPEENTEGIIAAIKDIQNPFPQLTDAQRYSIRQYSPILGREAHSKVEEYICRGLALRASSAARGRASPSERQLAELARQARAILPLLDRVDARTRLRILSGVSEADLSGVTRAEWWRILVGLLTAVLVGATDLAGKTEAKAGAPHLPDYIVSTVKLLGKVWQEYGPLTRQTNRRHPNQKLQQSLKDGSFQQWVEDLLVKALDFGTTSQIRTAVRQVVGDANREHDQQHTGHG